MVIGFQRQAEIHGEAILLSLIWQHHFCCILFFKAISKLCLISRSGEILLHKREVDQKCSYGYFLENEKCHSHYKISEVEVRVPH
jgi:hypothetical protein